MPFGENGQQTQTHLDVAPLTTTVVELEPLLTVPGSPLPVSPAVSCQGSGPSSYVLLNGYADRSTVPSATQ